MSGTSLDGLDLAYCHFSKSEKGWEYTLVKTQVVKYSKTWLDRLAFAQKCSAEELIALDVAFGIYLGKACLEFISNNKIEIDFIASHGHTVFHQPQLGFTYQIGNGNAIHATTGLPVIYDFRSLDVMRGGEGAPLVPAGDKLLFQDYDVCLNLGGIANLSYEKNGERSAFDICFCNMGLNYLMEKTGKRFDKGGQLAADGKVNEPMLKQLQKAYTPWRKKRPSLGRELFEKQIRPILDQKKVKQEDKLYTSVESTAIEIANAIAIKEGASVLCTGGGVFNSFMISRILHYSDDRNLLIIPEDDVVKFKEALVFAFLGVLRFERETNCFKSVTGATQDSSGGLMVGF